MTPSRSTPMRALTAVPRPRPAIGGDPDLRAVLGRFATGVTVLTAGGAGAHGMTANAFSSLSLEPPLLLCCVARAARLHDAVLSAQAFGVSVLGAEQTDVARHFADWRRPAGMAQFEQVPHRLGARTGSPLLTGALAWLECTLSDVHAGGDHSIFVGRVVACGHAESGSALAFFGGAYHTITPSSTVPEPRKDAS